MDFPSCSLVKNPPANAGDTRDMDSIPWLGRSPGEENGNSLQYSCLGNPWTEEPSGLPSMGLQKSQTDTIQRFNCNKFNVLQIHMK